MNSNVAIKLKVEHILDTFRKKEREILECLQGTETYKTAKSEFEKSVFCLYNIDEQMEYLKKGNYSELCVFLPMNQPLYSLVLFAIVPGSMFEKVVCRPPVLLAKIYMKLHKLLKLSDYNIFLKGMSRKEFVKKYVSVSDVIIYTGKYENALEVQKCINPKKIFIFQGSGTNPIIISENAIIDDGLINKVVESQIYNSGQDCMAPSAILVSKQKWYEFVNKLVERVGTLIVGEYCNVHADIAPMIEKSYVENVKQFLADNHDSIIFGGKVDAERNIIFPTIIEFKTVYDLPFQSSFSPIFCLYCYQNEDEVLEFLERPECQENKAYISVFGGMFLSSGNEIVINNDVLDSVDKGYSEFGGFGIRSGFVSYDDIMTVKPILISRELSMFRNINGSIIPKGDLENPIYEVSIVHSNIDLSKKSVLEIGCGTIPHAKFLAPFCESYVAVDKNQNKVKEAIANNTLRKLNVRTMDGVNLEYAAQSFDAVFMFHCLHEVAIEDQGAIIKEIYRVLKRNGYLFIIDTTSEYESDVQKLFNLVHENFFDYKHIYSVKHSEWIVQEYINRGFYHEIKKETHRMIFSFSDICDLRDCLLCSFLHEYNWDDISKQRLMDLIAKKYGNHANELEEVINFQILERI